MKLRTKFDTIEVAGELEKYGLRNASSPFDWMISDFEGVISCIFVVLRKFNFFLKYGDIQPLN